jgi:hypothetical protein
MKTVSEQYHLLQESIINDSKQRCEYENCFDDGFIKYGQATHRVDGKIYHVHCYALLEIETKKAKKEQENL